jgi:hypothetical protein
VGNDGGQRQKIDNKLQGFGGLSELLQSLYRSDDPNYPEFAGIREI